MNKREVVWLIVRLIGVYFGYSAFVTIFSVASAASALYALSSDAQPTTRPNVENSSFAVPGIPASEPRPKAADPAGDKLKSDAFKTLLLYIFHTFLYGGADIYLIRKGGILFDILANEGHPAEHREDRTVTTLKL